MKTVIMISFLMSSTVFAQPDFATKKQEALTRIDQAIAKMQEQKTCVAAAQKEEDMRKCHSIMRDARMERMEHRMKRMQEKTPTPAEPVKQ